jgi:hypothetical protein
LIPDRNGPLLKAYLRVMWRRVQTQEAIMGTLVFVCPTTGHEVSTGVEVDRLSFKSLPRTKTAIFCPHCRKNHLLATIWAWLAEGTPETLDKKPRAKSAA